LYTSSEGRFNVYVTIGLRPYNDPKLSDDMDDIYEDAWIKMKSVQTFIERLHLSEDLPENHNICITNLKTKFAKVFTEQGWIIKDQDSLLDEIIINSNRMMDRWVKAKKNRAKYQDAFIDHLEQVGKKKFNTEARNELKMMLYNAWKNGIVDTNSSTKQHTIAEEDDQD